MLIQLHSIITRSSNFGFNKNIPSDLLMLMLFFRLSFQSPVDSVHEQFKSTLYRYRLILVSEQQQQNKHWYWYHWYQHIGIAHSLTYTTEAC